MAIPATTMTAAAASATNGQGVVTSSTTLLRMESVPAIPVVAVTAAALAAAGLLIAMKAERMTETPSKISSKPRMMRMNRPAIVRAPASAKPANASAVNAGAAVAPVTSIRS